ncbi:MAG: phosphate ABC transporter substrate-binding protein [Nitrospirota bacterium]
MGKKEAFLLLRKKHRSKNKLSIFYLVSFILIAFLGCRPSAKEGMVITIAGSTSVQPFAEKLAEVYMGHHRGAIINVQGGGSTAGIRSVRGGAANIGSSSRELGEDEKDLKEIVIAWDGIAIIVNPENKIQDISLKQLRDIFAGRMKYWSELGRGHKRIHFVTREEGSGTRSAFEEMVMHDVPISDEALVEDSNGSVREIIAHDPYAIGYISYGIVDERVKALKIGGIELNLETIKKKKYRLTRPFLFVTRVEPQGLAKDFIKFILSPEGQKILEKEGLVGIR